MTRPKCWSFAMDFIGDPEQTEIEQYVNALDAEIERTQDELAAVKALLREADTYLLSQIFIWEDGDDFDQLHKRILAALGDEPADPGTGHKPE